MAILKDMISISIKAKGILQNIDIDKAIVKNIDNDIYIDRETLENTDIDKEILENIELIRIWHIEQGLPGSPVSSA